MTDNYQNKQKGINPLAAAVTGMIVGAGAVIAGAVALTDKRTSKKVGDALTSAKNKVIHSIKEAQQQGEVVQDVVEKKMTAGNRKSKTVAKKAINSINRATDVVKKEVKNI